MCHPNFVALTLFREKKPAKLLLFYDICKYFGKILQIILLFYLEGERTDQISFAEEVHRIETFLCL